jgi:hypothetical protein
MSEKLLEQFQNEVLGNGPEAALPCNLSDKWLDILVSQGEDLQDEENSITELLAAVMHLLFYKNDCKEVSIDENQLLDYLETYKVELSFEEVCRKTEFRLNPATLDTVFTDRLVSLSKGVG